MGAEAFETLPMPRKDVPQLLAGSYKVYKNAKEFTTVSAGSALEALQLSGVESAYKIERESIDGVHVLAPSAWGAHKPAAAPADAPTAGETAAASPAADADKPAADDKETVLIDAPPKAEGEGGEALSGDEVNKLLNN